MNGTEIFYSVLQERFGFNSFRPGQLEALEQLFQTGRLLCIQPTGRGKSLLYQLPACLLNGTVLVISPLLALMRDQVGQLNKRFKIPAGSLNSDQTEEENEAVRRAASEGKIRILFLSPEQLDHVDRFQFFLSLSISLIVIDEAHCISSWGHDFRPAFRQILQFVKAAEKAAPDLRVLGLTATAGARVEQDISEQLFSKEFPGKVLRESMDRPNIALSVAHANGLAEKLSFLEQILKNKRGALIYCATREHAELVGEFLSSKGVNAIAYHAGMEPEDKRRIQNEFMEGKFQAVAATNALGMGIDKADIRLILHFDIPGSITAYYQEVGRAGRDGLDAEGILLFDPKDRDVQEYFIHSAVPVSEDFDLVLEAAGEGIGLSAIKQKSGLHPTRANVVVAELVDQGFLSKESVDKKQIYRRTERKDKPDLSNYEVQRQVKLKELHIMLRYASLQKGCRMSLLRKTLGDDFARPCGRCDLCSPIDLLKPKEVLSIDAWLAQKPVIIPASRIGGLTEGTALFDSKLRAPLFVRFMRERQERADLDPEFWEFLQRYLKIEGIRAVVPLPSSTWKGREAVAKAVAERLSTALYLDLLIWKAKPEERQGSLLNNDQRKANVHEKMTTAASIPVEGPLLLLDDYTGSGATLKEAARALRESGGRNLKLIPFTIATVKWRLGKTGFI